MEWMKSDERVQTEEAAQWMGWYLMNVMKVWKYLQTMGVAVLQLPHLEHFQYSLLPENEQLTQINNNPRCVRVKVIH